MAKAPPEQVVEAASPPRRVNHVDLGLAGMTCATCASRIEKKLNRLPGALATVNFATEKASVSFDPDLLSAGDLLEAVASIGYGAQVIEDAKFSNGPEDASDPAASDPIKSLRDRVIVSGILALPVLVLSMVPSFEFRNWQWLSFALASPVVIWGGLPFHKAAWANLRHLAFSMDTLISMGSLAAYGWSVYALFFGHAGDSGFRMAFSFTGAIDQMHPDIYLETASIVVAVILFGRYLEARGKRRSGRAISDLAAGGTGAVMLLEANGSTTLTDVRALKVGDRFVVRAGDKIGTDGVVEEGSANLDLSLLTGEAVPRRLGVGDDVVGGATDLDGRLVVRATRVGSDTALGQLAKLVSEAQAKKAAVQHLVDRISGIFVPAVIFISVVTALVRVAMGDGVQVAFTAAVAVLIIACPCAMGLATPMAILVGTGRAAQLGILIRGPEALESAERIDTVVVDKTGTLTTGTMEIEMVYATAGVTQDQLLGMAASAESGTRHPLSRAVAMYCQEHAIEVVAPQSVETRAGSGVVAKVTDTIVAVGKFELMGDLGFSLPKDLEYLAAAGFQSEGKATFLVGWDGWVRGMASVSDRVRDDAKAAIAAFRALGTQVVLLSGDNRSASEAVGALLGVDQVISEVTPQQKSEVVKRLMQEGHKVAMVGDGINDAGALAAANLGISMGSGTDVAMEASDLTVFSGGLFGAVDAIRLSRHTMLTIRSNLFWAFAYNVAAIPLAALGLVNPVLAGAAMAFSSVFVVGNSLRLFRFSRVGSKVSR